MISNKVLQSTVAKKLEILRKKRELTISGLAERSGVSKATLSVLEDGSGNPTISTLWSIADALDVPFSDLINMGPQNVRPQVDSDGIAVQLIEQTDNHSRIEAYHMTIESGSSREASPHPAGVEEQVTVLRGHMLTGPLDSPKLIGPGEHYSFQADCEHIYSAPTENVSSIVTVQYPEDKHLSSEHTIVKSAPNTQDEWDGLMSLIHRNSIEVSNGLPVFRLVVRTGAEPEIVSRNIKARLLAKRDDDYVMPVSLYYVSEKEQLCLYIFPKSRGATFVPEIDALPPSSAAKTKAFNFTKANGLRLSDSQKHTLKTLADQGNLLYATLAAEALSIQGKPTLPHQIDDYIKRQHKVDISQRDSEEPIFEDRIDVHTYNAYELLHPGYARQTLAVGTLLQKYSSGEKRILDMGTGPGLPLLMLLDLIPDLDVTAIEPSPTAFAYLKKNTENYNVEIQCCDFLTLENHKTYPVITSTGASHHLNTAFFLQKANQLLDENGLLIIADEFIPPFGTKKDRNCALISHHIAYMLDVLDIISQENFEEYSPYEYKFIEPFEEELPTIAFMAQTSAIDAANSRLRNLLETIRKHEFDVATNQAILGFYSFLTLELEALVAGIDYEVERKTSPENFFALAEGTGFSLLEHQRIYPTSGKSKTDGGTHVMVFRKSI